MTLERASNRFTRDGTPGVRMPRVRLKSKAQVLKAFSDFVIDEIPGSISPGPTTSDVRTAPASGIVVGLETQLVELQK